MKRVFQKFGEIRQMDIPVLDPYRPKIDPSIDARKHSNPVLFDVFIQFKSYDGFMLCMDGLRDMKLVRTCTFFYFSVVFPYGNFSFPSIKFHE